MGKPKYTVTALLTKGGPCDGPEVQVTQISRNKAELRCCKCNRTAMVALPGGKIDLTGMAALDDGVARIHREDA